MQLQIFRQMNLNYNFKIRETLANFTEPIFFDLPAQR